MFTKTHYQTDQADLMKACGGVMSQIIDLDTGVKSAASDLIGRDIIDKYRPDKDHFLQHLVAMGDYETYGQNKNADAFTKAALEKYHKTFETNAHVFREHRNKDAKTQGIGTVKYAAFDGSPEGMHRVEMLIWTDKKKGEEEYEMAKQGKELSYSMSCRVPNDTCSCCGNKAKNRMQYCDHMRNHPNQYVPEFQKYAFVYNPEPTFFDISRVVRPADRIARYLEYKFPEEDLQKAASDNPVILGADWAEFNGLTVPTNTVVQYQGTKRELLEKLAALEEEVQKVRTGEATATSARESLLKVAHGTTCFDFTPAQLSALRKPRPGTLFRELAKRAAILPFGTFYGYVTDTDPAEASEDPLFQKASSFLPNIFRNLLSGGVDAGVPGMFEADDEFSCCTDSCNTDEVQKLMDVADREFGVCPHQSKPRILKVTVMHMGGPQHKQASAEVTPEQEKQARAFADAYGAYQIEALKSIAEITHTAVGEPELISTVLNNFK
jgi:hypothetical protein